MIKPISKAVLEIIPSHATDGLIQCSKHFMVVMKLNSTQLIFSVLRTEQNRMDLSPENEADLDGIQHDSWIQIHLLFKLDEVWHYRREE